MDISHSAVILYCSEWVDRFGSCESASCLSSPHAETPTYMHALSNFTAAYYSDIEDSGRHVSYGTAEQRCGSIDGQVRDVINVKQARQLIRPGQGRLSQTNCSALCKYPRSLWSVQMSSCELGKQTCLCRPLWKEMIVSTTNGTSRINLAGIILRPEPIASMDTSGSFFVFFLSR